MDANRPNAGQGGKIDEMTNGHGIMTSSDGTKIVGEFKDGKPTVGKYYDNDGNITLIGE